MMAQNHLLELNHENRKIKTFTLKEKEYKLLMMILEECEADRSSCGCNDPYDEEEKLFTKKERIEMSKALMIDEDEEELEDFMFNFQYVEHIINRIKSQAKKK